MKRLLIVDDDARFRELARLLLEGAPEFAVVGEAPDGTTALEASRELEPDVVLLDVNLPDANGFELVPQLAEPGGRTSVVLVSSRDDDGYVRMAEDAGAAGFLSKYDFSPAAIARIVG